MQTLNKKKIRKTCRCSVSKLCPKTRQMNLCNLLKWTDFILGGGGSKITADGDCSHEIKRCLLLGRQFMTNLDNIFKSKEITLPTKVRLVKAMVFPVVIYGCECWIIKKAELRRIDTCELWCWRRLENPLDCKEIQPVHPKGNHS